MKRKRINLLQENSDDEVEVLDVSITPKIIYPIKNNQLK